MLRATSGVSIPSRSLLRGLVIGMLMACLVAIVWVRFRGAAQAARVDDFLRRNKDASIQAQYGVYQYEPPIGMRGPYDQSLILRGGQRMHGFSVVGDTPRHLEWIIPILGEHCFARVTEIHVDNERFSDADVDLLLALPDLRAIDVSNTAITDEGLAKLATMERLAMLNISRTRVSSDALRLLSRCEELKELDISDMDATPEVVAYLKDALPDCWIRD